MRDRERKGERKKKREKRWYKTKNWSVPKIVGRGGGFRIGPP